MKQTHGFTIAEQVAATVLVAILAFSLIPRTSTNRFPHFMRLAKTQ